MQRHPTAAATLRYPRYVLQRIVTRVPIVSKFLTFFVPETLTPESPKPLDIKLAADAITTPPLRPRFNRPSGPRF